MNNPRLMWFLLSIPLVAMFMGVYGIWWAQMDSTYGTPDSEVNLSVYNRMSEINATMGALKERTTSIKEDQGAVDRLGNFFSNAYSILVSIPASLGIIYDFLNVALIQIPMGDAGVLILTTTQIVLTILIVVGIILAILLKVNGW